MRLSSRYGEQGLDASAPYLQLSGTILKGRPDSLLGTELWAGSTAASRTRILTTCISLSLFLPTDVFPSSQTMYDNSTCTTSTKSTAGSIIPTSYPHVLTAIQLVAPARAANIDGCSNGQLRRKHVMRDKRLVETTGMCRRLSQTTSISIPALINAHAATGLFSCSKMESLICVADQYIPYKARSLIVAGTT